MTPATPAPECAPPDDLETTWLPCPFCGSHNHSADKMEADDDYLRRCNDCGGQTAYYKTMEEADAAWNKPRYVAPARPPQPVDAEVVEAVRVASILNWAPRYRSLLMRAVAILRGEPDPAGGVK